MQNNNHPGYHGGDRQKGNGFPVSSIHFVNPYNFVPLAGNEPQKKGKNDGNAEEERLTGRIDYTLTSLTPLFIPNTSNDRIFGLRSTDKSTESDTEYHKNYDFFSFSDLSGSGSNSANKENYYEPVIPGSEIRGAVRSIYEALTDSCLPSMQKPSVIARRTPETYKAGVLVWDNNRIVLKGDKNGEGKGIPKNDLLYRDSSFNSKFLDDVAEDGFTDGEMVWFSRKSRDRGKDLVSAISKERTETCNQKGWIIIGMAGPQSLPKKQKKHCVHVFAEGKKLDFPDENPGLIKENLLSCIKAYQENNPKAYSDYEERVESFFNKESEGLPVYYSRIKDERGGRDHFYWSPACITREVYYHKLDQCIKGFTACEDTNHLCPACALFGMLNQNTGEGRGSRIRFSDAFLSEQEKNSIGTNYKKCYEEIVTLPELASPKIQATEFYLQKPKDVQRLMTWTYDYYISLDKDSVPQVHWYNGEEGDAPVIAGRKFYWHSSKAYAENVEKRQKTLNADNVEELTGISKGRTIRNQTVRPVKPGVSFSGTLYFNDITRTELNRLIAIMNMSDLSSHEGNEHYAIKLGTGKPIGMGSMDLRVDKVICRDASLLNDYTETVSNDQRDKSFNSLQDNLDFAVLKYLDYDALNEDQATGYLGTEKWPQEGAEGFQWFMKNREAFRLKKKYKDKDSVKAKGENSKEFITEETISSPNTRKQIHFVEYLQNGNSVTQKNGLEYTEEPAIHQQVMGGLVLEGVIDGYNPQKTSVRVKINNGKTVSVYRTRLLKKSEMGKLDLQYKRGDSIKIRYLGTELGTDRKMHEQWQEIAEN